MSSIIQKFRVIAILFVLILFCNFSEHNINLTVTDSMPVKDFLFGDHPPFQECHASTIIHLKNGKFITTWFGGTKEKNDDVGIWMAKGKPGHWEKPFEVAKINNTPHWNPVLFQSPEGKIYLFFKVGKEIPQWETWVKTSGDEGESWTAAKELVKNDHGGRGPATDEKGRPCLLKEDIIKEGGHYTGIVNLYIFYNGFAYYYELSL